MEISLPTRSSLPIRALSLLSVTLLLTLTGCPSKEEREAAEERRFGGVSANPQESAQFQAFIGKLRKAVSLRDYDMMAKLMTPNFGYDLNSNSEGPLLAIQYWNQNGLWPELERILAMPFSKKDSFVVSPPEFVFMTEKKPYNGFRAGMVETQNGYRFAYFVSNESFGPAGDSAPVTPVTPGAPDPNSYIGDTPPSDLPLPQSTAPAPTGGPRVIANPYDLEYSATPVPRTTVPPTSPSTGGPLTPAR